MPARQKIIWSVVIVMVAVVFGRAAWVASHADGGWEILREHLVSGVPPALHFWNYRDDQPQVRESKWVFEQAEKVANDPKSTAADLMGAALVAGANYDWLEMPNPLSIGAAMWQPMPHPNVALEGFIDWRERLWKLSRELAAKATQLEPDNVDWWRLRAGLLVHSGMSREHLEVLRSGSEHDPDNALYDYLIGDQLFGDSFGRTREEGDLYLADADKLLESKKHYTRAIAKPILALGERSSTVAGRLLSHADGSMSQKMGCYQPGTFNLSRSQVVGAISWPSDHYWQEELPQNEVMLWFDKQKLNNAWLPQWKKSGETLWEELANRSWADVLPTTTAPLISGLQAWRYRQWTYRSEGEGYQIWSVIGVAASAIAALFVLIAIISYLAARRFGRHAIGNPARGVFWRALLLWSAAFVPTFVILGIIPAFKLRLSDYHWSVAAVCILIPTAIAGWLLWKAARFLIQQRRLPAPQRSPKYQIVRWSLVVIVSAAFVVVMQTAVDRRFRQGTIGFFKEFPSHIIGEIQQMRIALNSHTSLEGQAGIWGGTWPWAVIQWGAHWGMFWTTVIWLLLMMAFGLGPPSGESPRARSSSDSKLIAKSSILISLMFLLISVAATTQWIVCLQEKYEQKLARLSDPGWLVKQIEAEVRQHDLELENVLAK